MQHVMSARLYPDGPLTSCASGQNLKYKLLTIISLRYLSYELLTN